MRGSTCSSGRSREDEEVRGPPITFPARYKPLPDGYRVVQLDSGHFMWIGPFDVLVQREVESVIDVDKYRVRRGAFAHAGRVET
jgi:hypothetical protein